MTGREVLAEWGYDDVNVGFWIGVLIIMFFGY